MASAAQSDSKAEAETYPAAPIDPSKLVPIPQPPTGDAAHWFGLLGNQPDLNATAQVGSLHRLHLLYGDIYQLDLLKRHVVVISTFKLANEVMDDEGWEKIVNGNQAEARNGLGDGLFTAHAHEPNWGKAHRLLMPVFGPLGIRKMFPQMLDISSQLVMKWDRLPQGDVIDAVDNFTRLAFDTISLCGFNYRFNDFYRDSMHPFAQQMSEFLVESGRRASRFEVETSLRVWSAQGYQDNIAKMSKLCDDLIAERKANPRPDVNDLLNTMLYVADPVTGDKLSDENVRMQLLTFLVAGHETTSGTLGYTFYQLGKNPEAMLKAQKEVDDVVGDRPIELADLAKLTYIAACIKETLRLTSPIAANNRHPKKDTVIGGKYLIKTTDTVITNLKALHTDPEVWGDDAREFKPERMFDMEKIPINAWRPFGVGIRGCIGRTFAEQEMVLTIALILQHFHVEMANPAYELVTKATLTTKPRDFYLKVQRRPGRGMLVGGPTAAPQQSHTHEHAAAASAKQGAKSKMLILYGSNAGTCKAFAQDLETQAPEHGFNATVKTLDSAMEDVPPKIPVVIIVPSYEGQPPDNARKFVSWLQVHDKDVSTFKDTQIAVFGVGNSEWAQTFHRVPHLISDLMTKQGAATICKAGFADVKKDCTSDWEAWSEKLWESLQGSAGAAEHKSELKADITKADALPVLGGDEMTTGIVRDVKSFGGTQVGPEKREITIELPQGVAYDTGDYLVVLPHNHPDTVQRVLDRFEMHPDDAINISGTRKAFLQSKTSLSVSELFRTRVELNASATQRQIQMLLGYAETETDKAALTHLASDAEFHAQVTARNYSLLDILLDHPTLHIPLSQYIDCLRPLSPRQYSIASSTLGQPLDGSDPSSTRFTVTLLYDHLLAPSRSSSSRVYHGACSSYLASLKPGNRLHCFVRRSTTAFHLPDDPTVPIVMISAGTGLAPMRGFIQERAAIAKAGAKKLGPAILYHGCRDYRYDDIYKQELDEAEALGVVEVRRAHSKQAPADTKGSRKYVHERVYDDKEEVRDLLRTGGKMYLCGSASKLAKSVRETLLQAYRELRPEASEQEAEEWFEKNKEVRYVTDVFD